jgi:G:T/U-mismatch repair DNA glycosylase
VKEKHPYIEKYFDSSRPWKYLIIGTFPPNKSVRENKKSFVDFFYGNRGTFWKTIECIYPSCKLSKANKEKRIQIIKDWMKDYNVGITDTITECTRTDINSAEDNDLIIQWDGYNHSLKEYLLKFIKEIEKIIFTSNDGCNSAFQTFKIIMGESLNAIPANKMILDLPSPSGSSNTAMFNVNKEESLGLHPDLFSFIKIYKQEHIPFFEDRWEIKKKKLSLKGDAKKAIIIPDSPKGVLKEFKVWKYSQILPKAR